MLSLNIKEEDHMCIDIAKNSIIHNHLIKKLTRLTNEQYNDCGGVWGFTEYHNHIIALRDACACSPENPSGEDDEWYSEHALTMLDSFHISLGEPPQTEEDKKEFKDYKNHIGEAKDIVPIIGDITLAPINISEKEGKKSAWIPLDASWILAAFWLFDDPSYAPDYELNLQSFHPYCDGLGLPTQRLHISLANLTGKTRDSITRPEYCIIDTITA